MHVAPAWENKKKSNPISEIVNRKRNLTGNNNGSPNAKALSNSSLGSYREAELVSSVDETIEASGKKVFLCEICNFRSNSRPAVKKHVFMTHSQKCPRYICMLCDAKIKERSNFKRHYVQVHKMGDVEAWTAVAQSSQTDPTSSI